MCLSTLHVWETRAATNLQEREAVSKEAVECLSLHAAARLWKNRGAEQKRGTRLLSLDNLYAPCEARSKVLKDGFFSRWLPNKPPYTIYPARVKEPLHSNTAATLHPSRISVLQPTNSSNESSTAGIGEGAREAPSASSPLPKEHHKHR